MSSPPASTTEKRRKLSDKQELFISAYLGECRLNATKAAERAGYSKARQSGSENLSNPDIRARINEHLEAVALTRNEVLALLVEDAIKSDEEIIERAAQTASMPAEASAISSLISARTSARTNLAKAHGLFTENVNHSGGIEIKIAGVDVDKI